MLQSINKSFYFRKRDFGCAIFNFYDIQLQWESSPQHPSWIIRSSWSRRDNSPLSFWWSLFDDSLSFWRSFLATPCHSEGAFSATEEYLPIEYIKIPCWNKKRFLDEVKKLLCRNDISQVSFWRSFSATEESLPIEYIKIPCWNKKRFLVEVKKLLCRNGNSPLSFWRSFSRLKNLFLSKT